MNPEEPGSVGDAEGADEPAGRPPAQRATSITLRALQGEPLEDTNVRDMVVAAARALAERNGIELLDVRAEPDRITCVLAADRMVALGFAAELRRSTTNWFTRKHGVETLWGEPPRPPERAPWEFGLDPDASDERAEDWGGSDGWDGDDEGESWRGEEGGR